MAQAFIDGLALASVIPAPTVIFGTFLGYLADGLAGAVLVTIGIFTPAFAFTLCGHTYLERAVDAVAAMVVGVLAVTAGQIAAQTLDSAGAMGLFAAALAVLYTWQSVWAVPAVVTAGLAAGWFLPL